MKGYRTHDCPGEIVNFDLNIVIFPFFFSIMNRFNHLRLILELFDFLNNKKVRGMALNSYVVSQVDAFRWSYFLS